MGDKLKMKIRRIFRIQNRLVRELLAELIGTFFLVTFAVGSGAQYVLSRGTLSSFLTVNFAGGMGLTLAIYWAGGVSGAAVNPAVTLGLCLHGVISWYKLPFYCIAQLAGAFIAAAVQYGLYYDLINAYDGGERMTTGPTATAQIFSTFPNPDASNLTCFFDQVFGGFILIGCILAITDRRNMKPADTGLLPIALGSIVFAIGTCWALNCGYALNPARDLGPRLFMAAAGWGLEPFRFRQYYWFWVPVFGPICGSILAWFLYNLLINLHWPDEEVEESELDRPAIDQMNEKAKNVGVDNPAFGHDPDNTTTHM